MAKARGTRVSRPKRKGARSRLVRVAVVTGTRAEFGLLRPVMHAIDEHAKLELVVIAGGSHLLSPAKTIREVEREWHVSAIVEMQKDGHATRFHDAEALGRGVEGFAYAFDMLRPDWVVVLGDRIEAFAAAGAASIAGIAVCHIHGGDRAEGIADEAMRHAITKLAHLHCAATKQSAKRIVKMGEEAWRVHATGSPAIDGLKDIPALTDAQAEELGSPAAVVLLHPSHDPQWSDAEWADDAKSTAFAIARALTRISERDRAGRVLFLAPNHDAGSEDIRSVFTTACDKFGSRLEEHLPRATFVGLLKWLEATGGVLVGNSSAGLIEAAAIGCRVINFGPRQSGRERAGRVIDVPDHQDRAEKQLLKVIQSLAHERWPVKSKPHPYGNGRSGERIAALLAKIDGCSPATLRKQNAY